MATQSAMAGETMEDYIYIYTPISCPHTTELNLSGRSKIYRFWSFRAVIVSRCPKYSATNWWACLQSKHVTKSCLPNYAAWRGWLGKAQIIPNSYLDDVYKEGLQILAHLKPYPLQCAETGNLAWNPTLHHFHCFIQMEAILQHPGEVRHASFPTKVAIFCTMVLGFYHIPVCVKEELGPDSSWSKMVAEKTIATTGIVVQAQLLIA